MGTILFADEEQFYISEYREALLRKGHTVLQAECAEETLALLALQTVDVLVLDVMMPFDSMDTLMNKPLAEARQSPKRDIWTGVSVWETVHARYPQLKVVILSVKSEQEIREYAPQLSWDGATFLHKVDDPLYILKIMRAHLDAATGGIQ